MILPILNAWAGVMTRLEARQAWRLFELNWLPIGVMAVALALGIALTDFTIGIAGAALTFTFIAVYVGFAYYNAHAPHRRDPQVVFVLGSTAQIVMITTLMAPMTYLAAAANFPMQDEALFALDRVVGLDWTAYVSYVNERPLLASWLTYGYAMIKWPIFGLPVVLAAAHRYRRLQEFTLAFGIALIITTAVSVLVPAYGGFALVDDPAARFPNLNLAVFDEHYREFPLVRDGSLRALDLFSLNGLVTFPSFHAASAALYTWAFWPVRWIRPFVAVAYSLMLASCPVDGAHYFIDLAAGLAVAVLAIAISVRLSAWSLAKREAEEGLVEATTVPPPPEGVPAK